MSQYITSVSWSQHGRRLAQLWVVGGGKAAQIEMPPGATLDQAWEEAVWLYDAIVEAELARDHHDTIRSVVAASYPI